MERALCHLGAMRNTLLTMAALTACAMSSGCVVAGASAAAGVGLYALQDRTIGEGIDDAAASQEVKSRLLAADHAGYMEVDVEVANGSLLLSGVAPSEDHKNAAEMIARSVRTVDHVYNEIFVGANSTMVRSAQDELITGQIRARLLASSSVRAININIETFNGNVYLMGLARTDRELQRAAEIASVVPGVQRVVSFMQVRAPDVTYANQGPAPVTQTYGAQNPGAAPYGEGDQTYPQPGY
jgi:osmotically-inducible protein OsmY